jgi:hypothetical protein
MIRRSILIQSLVLTLIVVAATPACGGSDLATTNQIWIDYYNYWPLTTHLAYDGDAGVRHAFSEFPWSRVYVRPALAWRWIQPLSLHSGIKVAYTFQDVAANTVELRPWVGVRVFWPKVRRVASRHHLLVEQRFQTHADESTWTAQTRVRVKVGFRIPLNDTEVTDGTFYVPVSVEFFADVAGELEERYASQSRLTVGLGYQISTTWRTNFEYTLQGSRDSRIEGFDSSEHLFHLKIRQAH